MRNALAVTDSEFDAAIDGLSKLEFPGQINGKRSSEREFSHVFVQNNGQITTFGGREEEEFLLGHILRDDLRAIFNSPALDKRTAKFLPTRRFAQQSVSLSSDDGPNIVAA
jgi:hypothetical protein